MKRVASMVLGVIVTMISVFTSLGFALEPTYITALPAPFTLIENLYFDTATSQFIIAGDNTSPSTIMTPNPTKGYECIHLSLEDMQKKYAHHPVQMLGGGTLLFMEPSSPFLTHFFHLLEHVVGAWAFYGHKHYEEVQRVVLIADGVNGQNWQGPNQLNFHMLHALFPRAAVRSWETFLKGPPGQLVCMQHAFLSDRGISMKHPECKGINKHLGASYTHMDPNAMESLSTRMQIYTHAQQNPDASTLHITYIKRPPPRCLGNVIERRMIQALLDIPGVQLTVLDFARLSFSEQIETILNTDILLSVHGNALSYVLFLPRHASVIELFPPNTHHLDYRVFAHARGIDYYGILYNQDQFLEPGQAYQLGAYGVPNEGINIVNCNLICHVVTQQFHKQLMRLNETSFQEKLVDQIAPVSVE